MLNLLSRYSLQEVIQFIILFALAIKGCITFLDWAGEQTKRFVDRAQQPEKLKSNIESHEEEIEQIKQSITELTKKIDMLIDSDRDDIKAFITREHHYFVYQKGWIDDYSLNCIEKRYEHYKDEGGNSFIKDLMIDIRNLPKQLSKEQNNE